MNNFSFSAHPSLAEPRELTTALAYLRLWAVAGQTFTVFLVDRGMRMDVPVAPLAGGIGVLATFALFALWRLRRPWPISTIEAVVHIAFDTAVLGWLLYFSGGASNPFVSLLLMPITLAAGTLGFRAVATVTILSALTYALLLRWYQPLPSLLGYNNHGDFGLHVVGMAVSFVISAAMLSYFIGRLAHSLRVRREEVQRIRERALRDEGILAIATQAAGAAHELNTPLSTMRTLLAELKRDHPHGALGEDIALLESQVERCRDSLRELVAVGQAQLSEAREATTLGAFVARCLDRFRLLRPEAHVTLQIDDDVAALPLALPPGLHHALMNLLNNAADASAARGETALGFAVQHTTGRIEFRVRDRGPGPSAAVRETLGRRFGTTKNTGLGLGFALANATAERLGGRLELHADHEGAETVLTIPLRALLA